MVHLCFSSLLHLSFSFNSILISIVFIGSPVRSMVSEDEDDPFSNNERDYGDDYLMEWAMVSVKRLPVCFALVNLRMMFD